MFKEGDVACGQADTVPNLERGRAAMPVGEGGLMGLGEGQFTGDGELYITNGVEVGRKSFFCRSWQGRGSGGWSGWNCCRQIQQLAAK